MSQRGSQHKQVGLPHVYVNKVNPKHLQLKSSPGVSWNHGHYVLCNCNACAQIGLLQFGMQWHCFSACAREFWKNLLKFQVKEVFFFFFASLHSFFKSIRRKAASSEKAQLKGRCHPRLSSSQAKRKCKVLNTKLWSGTAAKGKVIISQPSLRDKHPTLPSSLAQFIASLRRALQPWEAALHPTLEHVEPHFLQCK